MKKYLIPPTNAETPLGETTHEVSDANGNTDLVELTSGKFADGLVTLDGEIDERTAVEISVQIGDGSYFWRPRGISNVISNCDVLPTCRGMNIYNTLYTKFLTVPQI